MLVQSVLLRNPQKGLVGKSEVEYPKPPITAAGAILWEIKGVERAEQGDRGGVVGGYRIPFEGCFQGSSFKANRLCEAVVFPLNLSIAVGEHAS